jgi:hypothetical protein
MCFWFYIVQGLANDCEKMLSKFQWRSEFFFIVMLYFLLVKTAKNAPHFCKLRKGCLPGIGHGTTVFVAAF